MAKRIGSKSVINRKSIENTKNHKNVKFKNYFILFFSLIFVYLALVIVACLIPGTEIRSNVEKSCISILEQGINVPLIFNSEAYIIDTFSDAVMINMSYAVDSDNPIKSALESNQKILSNSANVAENLTYLLSDSMTTNWPYGRYWHGWMVILRPLLLVFDYSEIIFLNVIVMTLLLMVFLIMVFKYIGKRAVVAFGFGFTLINFWVVPLCLHYSSVFYIALIFGIILICIRERPHLFGLYFLAIGSMTCFFDLMSAPMVTLGVCLSLICLLNLDNGQTFLSEAKTVLNYCVLWFIGYSLTWGAKILLLLTLDNKTIFNDTLSQIIIRFGSVEGKTMDLSGRFTNILINFEVLGLNRLMYLILIVFIFIGILVYIFFNKEKIKKASVLAFIGLVPMSWYIFVGNHSQVHVRFTYRMLITTIVAYISLFLILIDKNKLISSYKKLNFTRNSGKCNVTPKIEKDVAS